MENNLKKNLWVSKVLFSSIKGLRSLNDSELKVHAINHNTTLRVRDLWGRRLVHIPEKGSCPFSYSQAWLKSIWESASRGNQSLVFCLEPSGMGKATQSFPNHHNTENQRGQMSVNGLAGYGFFWREAKFFWGGRTYLAQVIVTEISAENRWPSMFPWGKVALSATRKIGSPFRFPEAPCKNVGWCLQSPPLSLTYWISRPEAEAEIRTAPLLWMRHRAFNEEASPLLGPPCFVPSPAGNWTHTQHSVLTPQNLCPTLTLSLWFGHCICSFHFGTWNLRHLGPSFSSATPIPYCPYFTRDYETWDFLYSLHLFFKASDLSPQELSFVPSFSKVFTGFLSLLG